MTEKKEIPYEAKLFAAQCLRLEAFIRMYIFNGYSDREISSVLSEILLEILQRQNDPNGALNKLIEHFKIGLKRD